MCFCWNGESMELVRDCWLKSALNCGCAFIGRASSVYPSPWSCLPKPACECCVFTSPLPKLFFPSSTQIIFRITASRQPIPSLPVLFTLSNGYFQDYCTFVCMQYFMMLTTSSRKHPSFGASVLGSGCHRWYHTLFSFSCLCLCSFLCEFIQLQLAIKC